MPTLANSVHTRIRYLDSAWQDSRELPRIFDRESRRAVTEVKDVVVYDARAIADELDLDVTGFELFEHTSAVQDFQNPDEVKRIYFPDIKAFVKRVTGASEVYISHHQIRTEDTSNFNSAYARFLHCDYSLSSARSASLNLLKNQDKDLAEYQDAEFAWYNSWQPFDHTVLRNPLALLDARSLRVDDVRDYLYGKLNTSNKSSMPTWRSEHRHYYVSEMRTNEVLLIKQLDTREGKAKVTPHTSFDDPNSPTTAPPRRSVEVRMMCVFK